MNRRQRIAIATLVPFVACAVQWILWDAIIKPYVWFLFFPAAFFSAWVGGLRGGIVGTVISALLVWYVYLPPQFSFAQKQPAALASILIFVVMGCLFAWFFERLAQAMRRSEAALAETRAAGDKISQLYRKTLELDELKSQFFANVSHELRTPLTLILAPLEQRLHRPAGAGLSAEDRRETETMLRNARLLYRHVSDLLDVAKLEAGRVTLVWANLDLAHLVRVIASHFAVLADERQIDYLVIAPDMLPAEVDGEKLQRVLLNLLSNAFKFVPDGGRIAVRLAAQDGQALIEVQDNGPGVSADMRETVFERFRQGEGGVQRRYGGTGLGLAIVKDFVELHGGTVTIDAAPGGGALFSVRLPLTAPAGTVLAAPTSLDAVIDRQTVEELKARPPATAQDEMRATAASAPPILVVEDNPDMNAYIADALAGKYRVLRAYDGEQGLHLALAERPALIVTDLMMPGMSGEQMVFDLRARPETREIPVVVLTAKADDALRLRMLQAGVQEYISKPFVVEELQARIDGILADRNLLKRRLVESQSLLKEAQRIAHVGSWTRDLDGRICWSEETYRIMGMPDSFVPDAESFETLIHPDDRPSMAAWIAAWVAGQNPGELVFRRVLPDGQTRYLSALGELKRDAEGRASHMAGTIQDITERRQAEDALRQSEERFRLMASSVKDYAIMMLDPQGRILTWNEGSRRLKGFEESEILGRSMEVFYTPDDIAQGRPARLLEAAAVDGRCEDEGWRVRKDGTRFFADVVLSAMRDGSGALVGYAKITRDITEHRQMENALRESQSRLRMAIDVGRAGIWEWDPASDQVIWSDEIWPLYGLALNECEPSYAMWRKTVWPEDLARLEPTLRGAVQREAEFEVEWRVKLPEDRQRWLMCRGRPLRDEVGTVMRYLCIAVDITERKLAEEKLGKLNAELELRVAERTAELASSNRELNDFAYIASHDLKEPLRGLHNYATFLREDYEACLDDEGKRFLNRMQRLVERMTALIDQLLAYSRIGSTTFPTAAVDLNAVLDDVIEDLKPFLAEKGVELVRDSPLPVITCNATRVGEVFQNLLTNAAKYNDRPNKWVAVGCSGTAPPIFHVRDNGIGIAPQHLENVFRIFKRLHEQEKYGGGSGAGLTIVKKIIERHGGRIWLESTPGEGTTFYFTLSETAS